MPLCKSLTGFVCVCVRKSCISTRCSVISTKLKKKRRKKPCTGTKRRYTANLSKTTSPAIACTLHRIPTHTHTRTLCTKRFKCMVDGQKKKERQISAKRQTRLTESKLTRAKMAKVEGLSHTHLVLNEWTGTDLQLRADQEPSREELHREGERGRQRRVRRGEI